MKQNSSFTINIKGKLFTFDRPLVMGILNVTPDSFYNGCRSFDADSVLKRAGEIVSQGGDIIDVGAYSSRPGADCIDEQEELQRISMALPLIRANFPDVIISVDTFRSVVARYAVSECGADIINDITGGAGDTAMFETVASLKVPYIIMHMRGTPQTMQSLTAYDNVTEDVIKYFSERIDQLRRLGVNDLILDPGFGFAKSLDQNYKLMHDLGDISLFGLPIMVGVSRKSMIYNLLETTQDDSLTGTIALNMVALSKGANILRVHDVKECVDTIKIYQKTK